MTNMKMMVYLVLRKHGHRYVLVESKPDGFYSANEFYIIYINVYI